LERLSGNQQSALPESRTAGETLAVGYGVQLLFLEVNKAQVFHGLPKSVGKLTSAAPNTKAKAALAADSRSGVF
jgi:hypothetical protein